jgi:hypothetical protein
MEIKLRMIWAVRRGNTTFWSEIHHLEDLVVDGRTIVKRIMDKKESIKVGLNLTGLR